MALRLGGLDVLENRRTGDESQKIIRQRSSMATKANTRGKRTGKEKLIFLNKEKENRQRRTERKKKKTGAEEEEEEGNLLMSGWTWPPHTVDMDAMQEMKMTD